MEESFDQRFAKRTSATEMGSSIPLRPVHQLRHTTTFDSEDILLQPCIQEEIVAASDGIIPDTEYRDSYIETDQPQPSLPAFDDFDWEKDDASVDSHEDPSQTQRYKSHREVQLFFFSCCFRKNSIWIAYLFIVLLELAFIAVSVALHYASVANDSNQSQIRMTELSFVFLSFIWAVIWAIHFIVESVPWFVKRVAWVWDPATTEKVRMRMTYYTALRRWLKLFLMSAWGWVSWTFIEAFTYYTPDLGSSGAEYVYVVHRISESLFIGGLLLLVEKLCIQVILTRFHESAYRDRIANNELGLKVLDKLKRAVRKPPRDSSDRPFRFRCKGRGLVSTPKSMTQRTSFDELDTAQQYRISKYLEGDDMKPKKTTSNSDDSNQSTLVSEKKDGGVRFAKKEENTFISIPAENDEFTKDIRTASTGSKGGFFRRMRNKLPRLHSNSGGSIPLDTKRPEIERQGTDDDKQSVRTWTSLQGNSMFGQTNTTMVEAKKVAKKVFNLLIPADSGRDHLLVTDFYPYFKSPSEAERAFGVFDVDGNGDISKREFKHIVTRLYRERKNLATALRNLSQASGKLDLIFVIILTIIWIIIVCAICGVNVASSLTPLWTGLIALSFVFGTSAQEVFEAIIFVFVTHPYDAGDRVFIGPDNWVVHEMSLITTTFKQWDGTIIYVKNSVLSQLNIMNVRRSGPMGENMEIHVNFDTPTWKLHAVKDRLENYVTNLSRDFTPGCVAINIQNIVNSNRMILLVFVEHRSNWQDIGARMNRRTKFLFYLKEQFQELGITYWFPPQPVHISDMRANGISDPNRASFGNEGLAKRGFQQSGLGDSLDYREGGDLAGDLGGHIGADSHGICPGGL
ncbi:hypothetical protein BZG36_05409 [Bifiguratus adelaidae]|uniref:EF-hand domain-containing protein n=1 Tax=Bifiguratus adelaidae TaxID=1938954 RepID=A0A261XTX1_9FUNG|nr:hypothetical protein BZG36_05409 [Bifiguratus adelaidae]